MTECEMLVLRNWKLCCENAVEMPGFQRKTRINRSVENLSLAVITMCHKRESIIFLILSYGLTKVFCNMIIETEGRSIIW